MRTTKQAGGMEPEEAAASLTGALALAHGEMVTPEREPAAGRWAGRLTDWAGRQPHAPLLQVSPVGACSSAAVGCVAL